MGFIRNSHQEERSGELLILGDRVEMRNKGMGTAFV